MQLQHRRAYHRMASKRYVVSSEADSFSLYILCVLNLCAGAVGRFICSATGVCLILEPLLLLVFFFAIGSVYVDCVIGFHIEGHSCSFSSTALTTGRQLEDMWFLHTDVHARCFESLHRHRGTCHLQGHRCGSCFRGLASGCDCLR